MSRKALYDFIRQQQSYLCVGLDTDLNKIPSFLLDFDDPVFEFNKRIIDATADLCVAYKPNLAFYEVLGSKGWAALEKTINYIPDTHLVIADAKRGDIGNTSNYYAKAFFESLGADAITVAPYMGSDSVQPFLGFPGKWVIVLALTSNKGSMDFQMDKLIDDTPLYEKVMNSCQSWAGPDELMFVVGATHPEQFSRIREICPDHFLLIPGVGAQGGDLEAISRVALNDHCGVLVNASRSIIYAGSGEDFDQKAREAAKELQSAMKAWIP